MHVGLKVKDHSFSIFCEEAKPEYHRKSFIGCFQCWLFSSKEDRNISLDQQTKSDIHRVMFLLQPTHLKGNVSLEILLFLYQNDLMTGELYPPFSRHKEKRRCPAELTKVRP